MPPTEPGSGQCSDVVCCVPCRGLLSVCGWRPVLRPEGRLWLALCSPMLAWSDGKKSVRRRLSWTFMSESVPALALASRLPSTSAGWRGMEFAECEFRCSWSIFYDEEGDVVDGLGRITTSCARGKRALRTVRCSSTVTGSEPATLPLDYIKGESILHSVGDPAVARQKL